MQRAGWGMRDGRKELKTKLNVCGRRTEGQAEPVSHGLQGSKVGSGQKEE